MKVKCIDNSNWEDTLTINQIYEVLSDEEKYFNLKFNNSSMSYFFLKDRFEIIKENEMNINYHVLASSMVLNFDGKTLTINKSDIRYPKILEAIRQNRLADIPSLVDVQKAYSVSGLILKDNLLYLDNEALPEALAERILAFQQDQLPFEYLVKFARKLRKNPSYNSREQLYKFLEHNGHPITKEGNFIAYRGVTEDFKDKHTRKFDNSPGSICEMDRASVDDNPNNTCSHGLHVACYDYAKSFGEKLIEVEVDPMDVVCVPVDYNGTKMRTCKFKVVGVAEHINNNQLVDSSYESDDSFDDNADEDSKDPNYTLVLKPSVIIQEAKYNIEKEILIVTLTNGNKYCYSDVPYRIIVDWEADSSPGNYYGNNIIKYKTIKL